MDKEQLQNTIAKYYQKLSPNAQRVFSEMKWLEELKQLSVRYNMSSAQIEVLGTETTLALLGVISLSEYENALMRELGLGKNMADQLVAEIDEKILRNVRGELNNSYDQNLLDLATEQGENMEENANTSNSETGVPVKIENKISENVEKTADNVTKIIMESNYKDTLYKIADENDLSIEQMGLLEEIINESFAGKISSIEFANVVKQRLGLPETKINLLVSQINEKILKAVRAKIIETSGNPTKTETKIEINQADKDIMKGIGFDIQNESQNKMREFNREDYKESYMKNAGIKVEKEKTVEVKKEIPENKEAVLGSAGIKILDDTPSKESIQNKSILAEKLSMESVSQAKETDHSVQDISNILNSGNKKQTDPYRMPIE